MARKILAVVAGVIRKGDKILIAQRAEGDGPEGGKWEFPGGKIEKGERPADALVREIKEELDVRIRVSELYTMVHYNNILLLVFLADYVSGKVKNKGCQDSKWVSAGELKGFDFAGADIPAVKKLGIIVPGPSLDVLLQRAKATKGAETRKLLAGFRRNRQLPVKKKFIELCFCILVANSNLEQTKKAWEHIGNGFLSLDADALQAVLRKNGVRFHNRATYMVEARAKMAGLGHALQFRQPVRIREWLHDNIKGLGWKESSHFLRNMGFTDFAILDTHVAKVMRKHGLIRKAPESLSSEKTYLALERILKKKATELGINMAELDCCLFYIDSGKLPQK